MAWRNRLAQARVVAADDPSLFSRENTNNAIIQSMRDRLESTARPSSSSYQHHPDAAYSFDQVLKKLETTKQRHNKGVQSSTTSSSDDRHSPRTPSGRQTTTVLSANDSYDDSSSDSRNDRFFASDDVNECITNNGNGSIGSSSNEQQRLIETRQQFVDRQVDSPPGSNNTVVDSFCEKQQSTKEWRMESEITDTSNLPSAILKLDQRFSIPAPMHKNDVLVEIEAYTVDKKELMIRPGVRCTGDAEPQGVTTIGMDCIGHIVQLTNHARAVYGISADDRVAAIYPFDYNTDKLRRNTKYALVDAGFVVAVPKDIDAAEAACMIRLYVSAFQSILMGIGTISNRYGSNQLCGLSILIQNGHTEFGRALIQMATLLGASRIFATGPTECHALLSELGASPLGAQTFSWELFIEEKIGLVLVQEMPTADNFEQYISILDESKGNLVYTTHGHKHVDDDNDLISMENLAEEVSCSNCLQCGPKEITRKAQAAINSARFSLRLSLSPKYLEYEGLWASCKEDSTQFKEDLRYLFALLGRGNLKPNITECISLDEIAGVQERIEIQGKMGTVICLPFALSEKKSYRSIDQESPRSGTPKMLSMETQSMNLHHQRRERQDNFANNYAVDSGYLKESHINDSLSDFHRMHDHGKLTNIIQKKKSSLPSDLTRYSSSTCESERIYSDSKEDFLHHLSLLVSSNDQDDMSDGYSVESATNYPSIETSVLPAKDPLRKSKRYQAYHQYHRHKLAEVIQPKSPRNAESTSTFFETMKSDELVSLEHGCSEKVDELGSKSSVDTSSPTARKLRRESRKKQFGGTPDENETMMQLIEDEELESQGLERVEFIKSEVMGEVTDDRNEMLQSNEFEEIASEPATRELDNKSPYSPRGERPEPTPFNDKNSSQMKQALESLSKYTGNKVFVKGRQSSVDCPPSPRGIQTKPSTSRSRSSSRSQLSIGIPLLNESREEENSKRDECSRSSSFQSLKSKWDSSDNQASPRILLAKTEIEHAASSVQSLRSKWEQKAVQ